MVGKQHASSRARLAGAAEAVDGSALAALAAGTHGPRLPITATGPRQGAASRLPAGLERRSRSSSRGRLSTSPSSRRRRDSAAAPARAFYPLLSLDLSGGGPRAAHSFRTRNGVSPFALVDGRALAIGAAQGRGDDRSAGARQGRAAASIWKPLSFSLSRRA